MSNLLHTESQHSSSMTLTLNRANRVHFPTRKPRRHAYSRKASQIFSERHILNIKFIVSEITKKTKKPDQSKLDTPI